MIELALAFLGLGLLMVLLIPGLLVLAAVGMAIKLAFLLILLPFKLLFVGLAGLLEAAGALLKLTVGFFLFVVAGVFAFALLLVPGIPAGIILLAAGLAWFMTRLVRGPHRDPSRA